MRIGILGTGELARGLGTAWVRTGHDVTIGGRSPGKAADLAAHVGAAAAPLPAVVRGRDAVLLAVAWAGVEDVLREVGAADGSLAGTPLIDPSNSVEHGVGVLLTEPGRAAAQRVAELAPGAHVVKAFHLFPAGVWVADPVGARITVAMCGDDPGALQTVSRLVSDVGAQPAVLGGLDRARQLEEVAGFVIGLAFAGVDPNAAIPRVPAA
jgi:8-hydroxy-5-deazaflavin:NADPH oxidoreductase